MVFQYMTVNFNFSPTLPVPIPQDVIPLPAPPADATKRAIDCLVKVAQRWFNGPEQLSVATGLGFQDALAGSPLSAQTGTPLLLSSAVPTPATYNYAHAQVLVSGVVYGTSGSLPQSAAADPT